MPTEYSLARLVAPLTPERFFAEYWEQKPLVIRRGDPNYFRDLLSIAEIDRVITTLSLHHPQISVVNAARTVRKDDYTFPSELIDVARLYQQYADGGTIILPNLEARIPALAALCRSMEEELSTRFQTNIYLTPGDAQGFRAHYDNHDVFVLQVEGTKHWLLYDTPVELPYRGQNFNPEEIKPGAVSMEFDLTPGDVAYIPRGIMHDARTGSATSLHITLGVMFTSWTDLLLESLAMVGLRDPLFRKSLPPGFARPGYDRAEARKTFKELLRRVADYADFDAAIDHFAEDLITTRHPLLSGQMAQVEALRALTPESRVAPRESLLYKLEHGENSVTLVAYGGRITLPAVATEPLTFALTTRAPFAVRDLPGTLDNDGKLVLVRRLVREGVLKVL